MRSVRRTGILHPSPVLCFLLGLLLGNAVLGAVTLGELRRTLAVQAQTFVELQPSATDQDVQEFYAAVQDVGAVADVELVSKEQALAMQRERHPDLASFLDRYQLHNPFSDAFQITLRSAAGFEELRAFLQNERWAPVLDRGTPALLVEQEASLLRLQHIIDILEKAGVVAAIFLGILTLFIVTDMTLARLMAREEERRTITLLGGGWVDSDGPVLLEMALTLWAAFACSAVVVAFGATVMPDLLRAGTDTVIAAFLGGIRVSTLAALPLLLLTAFFLVPCAALLALLFARLRLPLRHG